jgi:hypothetical protein
MSNTNSFEKRKNNDDNNDEIKITKQKIKHEYHNPTLSKPTPNGIKRYVYHEHIRRTVEAPNDSSIYTENQLEEFLTDAVAIYQMLYFIRNKNHRFSFLCSYLDRIWHIEEFGHWNYWKECNRFYYFYADPKFDQDLFESALNTLFEKTQHEKIHLGNKHTRLKTLLGIFNKINISHVERDI